MNVDDGFVGCTNSTSVRSKISEKDFRMHPLSYVVFQLRCEIAGKATG